MARTSSRLVVLLVLTPAVGLSASACQGAGSGQEQTTTAPEQAAPAETSDDRGPAASEPLPPGGLAKVLRGARQGVRIKAVVYGVSGTIDPSNVTGATLRPGHRFTSVKVGIRNLGRHPYSRNPVLSASIEDTEGRVYRALRLTDMGLGRVELDRGETQVGRIFFEVAEDSRAGSFRFKPFGAGSPLAVFTIRGGKG